MIRKVIYNDESKDLSVELEKEIAKLKKLIYKLETSVGLLQAGAYWNGANAYDVNQGLIGHLDHDMTLLKKLENCSESLKIAIK